MTTTIRNTGRPLHNYRIHTSGEGDQRRPSRADCDCGALWYPGGQSVADWGMTHVQPDPETARYNRQAVAHLERQRTVQAAVYANFDEIRARTAFYRPTDPTVGPQ